MSFFGIHVCQDEIQQLSLFLQQFGLDLIRVILFRTKRVAHETCTHLHRGRRP